jgi:two-component system, OmpR family, sensor histidine kinase KdpD
METDSAGNRDKTPLGAMLQPIISPPNSLPRCAAAGTAANSSERQLMRQESDQDRRISPRQLMRDGLVPVPKSLLLVAVTTIGLLVLDYFFALRHVTLVYLVPVVIAATKLGIVPAVIAAIAGAGASAFFFYAPIYDFRVEDPQHLIEFPLYIFVAIVTGHLATNVRRQADLARRRENEVQELYTFSRRIAAAHTADDIYRAIREHLASIVGSRTLLFETAPRGGVRPSLSEESTVPERVRSEIAALADDRGGRPSTSIVDGGRVWIVRPISGKRGKFAVLAIDLGPHAGGATELIAQRVDAVLQDATATLEHLDLDQVISDARVRSETEALRDALIGSVSHQLRTPLVSILGAATVISQAPGNKADPRLASLADILRDEVDRLNNDVQDLLDAALITSEGVRLDCEWVEPADIVNAAIDRRQRLLAEHRVAVEVPAELPFVYVDPILLEQALGQIIDNAAKYSRPGSTVAIAARPDGDAVVLSVKDEGVGLVGEERTRLWERFFRGERHAANVSGSGLGLWIAKAFVGANGGAIEAFSEGADRGTLVSIRLPATEPPTPDLTVAADE